MESQGLGYHRLPGPWGAYEQKVAPLARGNPCERDSFILTDHPHQRILWNKDIRRRFNRFQVWLAPQVNLSFSHQFKSSFVQISTEDGCFVTLLILVPTTVPIFFSVARSRIL
jgi:hypothetical protein